jgi:hypothetical protein
MLNLKKGFFFDLKVCKICIKTFFIYFYRLKKR